MSKANAEILDRYVGPDDQEITHIGMVQAYGVTDSSGEPTISRGYASAWSAMEAVKEFVHKAHLAAIRVDTRRVVLDEIPEHAASSISVHIVRSVGGPSWGMVIETP